MDALSTLWTRNVTRHAVCTFLPDILKEHQPSLLGTHIALIPRLDVSGLDYIRALGWELRSYASPGDIQGVIVLDPQGLPQIMRLLTNLMRDGCIIVPLNPDWVVAEDVRKADAMYCARQTTAAANYAARCNLRGHFLEFGTFWGRSFFPSFFQLRHWLKGDFYAFDSFEGLSKPLPDETEATAGDFIQGTYNCNLTSFEAIADLVAIDRKRLKIVPGYFENSLKADAAHDLGLSPRSVSICYIDCDIREPTEQVLNFVSELLEDGALIYFDDWRLCRASPHFGERAAALAWLERNPNFELIEFASTRWQNQWFIFQRK